MQIHDRTKKIAFAGLLTLFLISGCGGQNQAGGPQQGAAPEVAVVTVQPRRLVVTTELAGRTAAYLTAEVRPQVSGIIQKRLFTEGANVQAGQILYQIDPAIYQAALDNAEANFAAAQKNADRARAALAAGIAGVDRYRTTLELARKNSERFNDAFRERAVSAAQRDQADADAKVAAASLQAAEAQVESDRKTVAAAEASISQAKAALEAARINLGYTSVKAPISGRIGISGVTEGALVTAQQPAALSVIKQLDPMYVDVAQSTTALLKLRQRMESGRLNRDGSLKNRVRLVLEDDSLYPWEGELQLRDVTVEASTGSVTLRIVFPNPKGLLLPGMFVRALVEEGVNHKALLVPQQGVSRNPKGEPMALIVDKEGKVRQRMLTLERAIADEWLVGAGLAPGDRIIVEGMQKVKPGASVRVVAFEEPGKDNKGERKKAAPTAAKPN